LKFNVVLERLGLWDTEISDAAAVKITEALSANSMSALAILDLTENPLSFAAVQALADVRDGLLVRQ
jgi:hypothetical protein